MLRTATRRLARAVALVVPWVALTACGPSYDHVEFMEVSQPPTTVSFTPNRIRMAKGSAVRVVAVTVADGGEGLAAEEDGPLDFRSLDPAVIDVERMVDPAEFIFTARGTGATEVEVLLGGSAVDRIPAEVVDQ